MEMIDGIEATSRNLDLIEERLAEVLTDDRRREFAGTGHRPMVMFGMGGSLHVASLAAHLLRSAGCPVLSFGASEPLPHLPECLYLGISFSGGSQETLAAITSLRGTTRVALTGHPASPLGGEADLSVPMSPLGDTPVSTLSFTGGALALVRFAEWIYALELAPAWASVATEARELLGQAASWAREMVGRYLLEVRAIDFVGRGPLSAVAEMAALITREAARVPCTGYETRQYLHGPMEPVDGSTGAVVFGSGRELQLIEELRGYGAHVLGIATSKAEGSLGPATLALPEMSGPFGPIIAAVVAQRVAYELATARGLVVTGVRRKQTDTHVASP
jgi:glucosamine--fructose-6-phosphate aminotransferase (isomerizing)